MDYARAQKRNGAILRAPKLEAASSNCCTRWKTPPPQLLPKTYLPDEVITMVGAAKQLNLAGAASTSSAPKVPQYQENFC